MSKKVFIIVTSMLGVVPAYAQEPLACSNSLGVQLAADAPADIDIGNDGSFQLETGSFEADLKNPAQAQMTGGILLRSGDKLAGAENARFVEQERAIFLDGDVRYEDTSTEIRSDSAEFAYDSGRIRFAGAEFSLGSNNGRGSAGELLITDDGQLNLGRVSYTTCQPGSEDWLLQARQIKLDTRNGVGTAKGIKLRFQGVPILYAPYISFPIGDARKSGVLTPEIGSAGRSGNEIRVPWYWNIAPNYDATITPRLLTDRGLQAQVEFRYLSERHEGIVTTEFLPSDNLTDESRHLFEFDHKTVFDGGWRTRFDVQDVSDSQYFEDLGGSLSISSLTHLNRSVEVDYFSDRWSFLGRAQDYQTLDDAITPDNEPYRRLPQVLLRGNWPDQFLGTHFSVDSELVNFDRDTGVTGWRFNVAPQIELPLKGPGWFIKPAVKLDHTRYELSDVTPGNEDSLTRSLPITSLDTGLILERAIERGESSSLLQTIEPRLLYVHIPHRDQDMLPVFDTIAPDLNLVQLFRKDRLLGVDRIVDTDQLSLGITSRILDLSSGKELVTATVGQAIYLSDSGVDLPGQPLTTSRSSDYIAEVGVLLYNNWNFGFGHQWGTGDNATTQSEARLQYRPANDKLLNVAYRFRRDSLEQGDLSWSWPLSKRWNFVGRYNYSFRDDEVLEQFFGLEYESCCWGLRLVSRRHISTRDGTRDSSFGLQLVLKGMTSVGNPADKLLERGILGYSARLR